MIQFPNCKINLGLRITNKRDDGYHNLDTIFYPLPLHDALELINGQEFSFAQSGIIIEGNSNDNLVIKAYQLLKRDYPSIAPIQIHLLKKIPTGAGLGGGSADASFMLMMLNKHFQLNISKEKILAYALQLGSDCPFFIHNVPCYGISRGEELEPVHLDLSAYKFLLVKPNVHIPTSWAFQQLSPVPPLKTCKQVVMQPIATWQNELINDFETPIFKAYPQLASIKQTLIEKGALYASMSGSGSTVYGIFTDEFVAEELFPDCEHYWI